LTARTDGAMVLNGKSDPRDTTHPAIKLHKVFFWSSSFIFTILHRARLFLSLVNLNFYRYRQRSMYRNWVDQFPSLGPLVRKDTHTVYE
jgi:hypothetical protein